MRPAATACTPCRGHLELRICIHRRKASLALAYDLDAVPFSEVQMTRPVAGCFCFGFLARKNYISFHQDGETMQMSRIRHTECHSAKSKQRNFRVTGLSAAGEATSWRFDLPCSQRRLLQSREGLGGNRTNCGDMAHGWMKPPLSLLSSCSPRPVQSPPGRGPSL